MAPLLLVRGGGGLNNKGRNTSAANLALGGAWHAQEAARQRSQELAARAELRAAAAAAENEVLRTASAAMERELEVALGLLGKAKEKEGERERALVKARGSAAASAAASRAHVLARLASERRATEVLQREAVLEATVAQLELRETGLRARLASEVEDNSAFQDLYHREQHKNETLTALLAERQRKIDLLKHTLEQKNAHIATLTKEKTRFSDRVKRLQEEKQNHCRRGRWEQPLEQKQQWQQPHLSSFKHQNAELSSSSSALHLSSLPRPPHSTGDKPASLLESTQEAAASAAEAAAAAARDGAPPLVSPSNDGIRNPAIAAASLAAVTTVEGRHGGQVVMMLEADKALGVEPQRQEAVLVLPTTPTIFSPVNVAEHGQGLLFTPPQCGNNKSPAPPLCRLLNEASSPPLPFDSVPLASGSMAPHPSSSSSSSPSSPLMKDPVASDASQYFAASVLLTKLRKAKTHAERMAAERDAAVAARDRAAAKCSTLQVQLRNRIASAPHLGETPKVAAVSFSSATSAAIWR